ncbi:hypothetical protein B2G52_05560 [Neisseria lactamica]|uniref:Phage associated protein n=1 Tax=Neisseria lactamica TaxID=486 RepID=A0AAU8VFI8_NEILA|nr:hypothetical protein B2G52_05560 [Neisseria lactamica]
MEGKQGFKGFGKRVAPVFFIKLLGNIGRNRTGRMRTVLRRRRQNYRYIPCLNDHPDRIGALERLVKENLGGGY